MTTQTRETQRGEEATSGVHAKTNNRETAANIFFCCSLGRLPDMSIQHNMTWHERLVSLTSWETICSYFPSSRVSCISPPAPPPPALPPSLLNLTPGTLGSCSPLLPLLPFLLRSLLLNLASVSRSPPSFCCCLTFSPFVFQIMRSELWNHVF